MTGIQARGKRRFRVTTTDSRHTLPIAPNLLDRHFTVEKPNMAWTGDVTYIATDEGWLYLAVVIDLFSRRIVGWSMKTTIDRPLVIDVLEMACMQRRPEPGKAIFHSDRGSVYASEDYREVMKMYGLVASMSRKANCWDTQFNILLERRRDLTRAGDWPSCLCVDLSIVFSVLSSMSDLDAVT